MPSVRNVVLHCLPKVVISRVTGLATRLPLPRFARMPLYRWFARRYGATLDEIDGRLDDFRSLAQFFQRPLRDGTRPIAANAALVWPCDGRIVASGPIDGVCIEQVKGLDYPIADLLGDRELADALAGGSQSTVYLAPGDYHRVHSPFEATITAIRALPGALFPVNPPAQRCIPRLFARNARVVFEATLGDGRRAALVMVAAMNVGDVHRSVAPGARVARGDEIGRFGFGSTVVAIVGPGEPAFAARVPHSVVRQGATATDPRLAVRSVADGLEP